jgi:hypothetical protein
VTLRSFVALVGLLVACPAFAGPSLPFTRNENEDGAKWVWFIYQQQSHNYGYVSAKDFPSVREFVEVTEPQPGDVAWWCGYMTIVAIKDGKITYMTAESPRDREALESLFGKPRFFRFTVLATKQ